MFFNNLKLGHKVLAILFTAIVVLFGGLFIILEVSGAKYASETSSDMSRTISSQVTNTIDLYEEELKYTELVSLI